LALQLGDVDVDAAILGAFGAWLLLRRLAASSTLSTSLDHRDAITAARGIVADA
jgi:hypothetical protein